MASLGNQLSILLSKVVLSWSWLSQIDTYLWFFFVNYHYANISYTYTTWPLFFHPSIRTITMGHGPHLRHRPPLPPPCWSDKERGACLFQGARMKHPGAPRSAPQRMAATALTSPAASVVSLTMTATWSVVTSAGNHPVDTSLFPWSFFFLMNN